SWKNPEDPFAQKGNDRLVNAYAKFLTGRPEVRACLVMFEYGDDVEETKSLVRALDIEKNVRWFPAMYRKDLMVGLSLSDIGCGEFAISCFGAGTVYETLAMGKPLLHYRDDAQHRNT